VKILDHLLNSPLPLSPTSPQTWSAAHARLSWLGPDAALAGGFAADRPAWAFASGYRAALDRLLPTAGRCTALCVTESGGNHPRAIDTRLVGERLVGHKRYVFLGPLAERLFVLARVGSVEPGTRAALRIFELAVDAPGVQLHVGRPTPMMPELSHAEVALDAAVGDPLPGDAWTTYVRPFRTVEDVHVTLALLGHGLRCAREGSAEPNVVESLLPPMLALRTLATSPPTSTTLHRALAPSLAAAWTALDALSWPTEAALRWQRDRAILKIGAQARRRRLERARRVG